MPASTDRSAEKWQYWQSMASWPGSEPACVLWGNAMGCTVGALAGVPAAVVCAAS